MMQDSHPNDVELFEYLEGDLDETAAAAVRAHVTTCEACARELAEAERARDVLHATPSLRLPHGRLEQMLASLPRQEAPSRDVRSFIQSRRRLLLVATPAAAALAAVVIAFAVTSGGGDDSREAGEAAAAQTAAADAQGSLESAPALEADATPVVRVQGPPRAIVRFLRAEGFTARRVEGQVIVVGARPRQVRRALAERPRGDVPVFVIPAGQ
jgi:anti-sigma factor RsiW